MEIYGACDCEFISVRVAMEQCLFVCVRFGFSSQVWVSLSRRSSVDDDGGRNVDGWILYGDGGRCG